MPAGRAAARMIPVLGLGVVEAEPDAVFAAGGREFLERIPVQKALL